MKVMLLRPKLRTGNVHGRQAKNGHRLIHAGLNHAQQARLRSRLLQSFREQERANAEHDAVQQLHPSAGVEDKRQHHNAHINELGNNVLCQRQRQELQFHVRISGGVFIDRAFQTAIISASKRIGLYLGNAADVFQHALDHCRVTGELSSRRFLGLTLQGMIDKIIYHDPSDDQEPDAPVKEEHRQCKNRCRDDTLGDKHCYTGRQPRKVIHRVCRDRGN